MLPSANFGALMLSIENFPSPNFGERASGKNIDMIVLHYTGMVSADSARRWLCDERSKVSAHYFVFEDGRIARLVGEEFRAWHAGVSFWAGERDINSRSIGIEIANPGPDFGYPDFPAAQIDAVIELCRDISTRHSVPRQRVLAHSDVAPLRKRDPGEKFPWARLAEAGIGQWCAPAPTAPGQSLSVGAFGGAVKSLQQDLAAYGYDIAAHGVFDWTSEAAVIAFQRHFRSALVDGIVDQSTRETLATLLRNASSTVHSKAVG